MKEMRAITTVYSYYFREVRDIITRLTQNYPHNVFLKSVDPGLDDFHIPIINRFLEFQKNSVPALVNFPYRYPTAGAEEGIREILSLLELKGIKKIYVLSGEYEGYKAVAETRGIEVTEVGPAATPEMFEPGYWFISNPSARDGNIIFNDFIGRMCQAGHKVVYDLSYLGLVRPFRFDVSHPNIIAVLVSFSKPYGLFYYRIGFTFSRDNIPSLYGNKWFKNVLSLMIADRIMQELTPFQIFDKYKPVQKEIIAEINSEHGLNFRGSDVLLLGHLFNSEGRVLSPEKLALINRFQRGPNYRFCLTPYFEALTKEGKI